MDLALVWLIIIATTVAVYVVLDGFDLGLGILFPWVAEHGHRDLMMNSVAPIWDGNETWLVLGGTSLFAAFPLAYSVLLPALYIPLLLMLSALVFRGVAFEFRFKAHKSRFIWDIAFCFGSSLAVLCQGLVLGAVVQGFDIVDQRYAGGPFDWFTPFSLATAISVMVGYALLGTGWLIIKTEGDLRAWSYKIARWLLGGLLAGLAIVSIWTPLAQPAIAERWFSLPNFYFLSQIPLLTLLLAGACWYVLKREKHDKLPFVFSIGLFLLAFSGLIISLWPYIVPRAITYEEVAAAESTLIFVLIGLVFLLPLVIAYTVMAYRVFSGKVRPDEGYH